MPVMKKIIDAEKSFNGILVTYISGDSHGTELFSYENLIDMRINALELLDHPDYYSFDTDGPAIVRTEF